MLRVQAFANWAFPSLHLESRDKRKDKVLPDCMGKQVIFPSAISTILGSEIGQGALVCFQLCSMSLAHLGHWTQAPRLAALWFFFFCCVNIRLLYLI